MFVYVSVCQTSSLTSDNNKALFFLRTNISCYKKAKVQMKNKMNDKELADK